MTTDYRFKKPAGTHTQYNVIVRGEVIGFVWFKTSIGGSKSWGYCDVNCRHESKPFFTRRAEAAEAMIKALEI